ncbi:hypothetical protein DAERI_040042 [Deinococcus aerius]|uniref:RHS repeat-associated core domain-containing protein n=1 Tax=Deinococcus aerius TaxID=200253 RepID=A0A2I9CU02_9DEIO|nr:hypothetical protein [Deinococcus aerius]GBF05282.1 hypothetical protein DAERI_040042 [Deinococcus aerius]
MNLRTLAASLVPLLLAPALAQTNAQTRQAETLQEARVQVARETAQVRLLERSGALRSVPVSSTCLDRSGRPLLTVLVDPGGTPRIVRYNRQQPDNSVQFTGYYDAAGRLRLATGSASGFSGLLYNLTAEYDPRGIRLYESGTRRPGYTADLRYLGGLSANSLRLGRCPS